MTCRLTRTNLLTQQAPQHHALPRPVALPSSLKTAFGMGRPELGNVIIFMLKENKTRRDGSPVGHCGAIWILLSEYWAGGGTGKMAQQVQRLAAKTNSLSWVSRPTRWEENSKSPLSSPPPPPNKYTPQGLGESRV